MRINFRQIEAFRAVLSTGTMTAAADLMGITQPAISRLIRDLEAEIGIALFERAGAAGWLPRPTLQCFTGRSSEVSKAWIL